jgi:UMF1 family MFS transporter
MIPAHKSTEFFGFFAFASKVAGVSGPLVFWLVGSFTSSNRPAVLVIALFFVAGGLLLRRVDVDAGRSAARKAEAELRGGYST